MKLHFLGRGAAFYTEEGNTAAYLEEDDRLLLIDCGETVFERLKARGLLNRPRSVDVMLTHLHGDHAGSLSTLSHYCYYILHSPLRLILPEDEAYRAAVKTMLYVMAAPYDHYTIAGPDALTGQYEAFESVGYIPTRHSTDLTAWSVAFETRDGGVFYSGDTCTTETLREFLQEHAGPEAVYMDSTDAEYLGNVHLPVRLLAEAVPEKLRSRVFMMHINSPACVEKGKALGFGLVSCD